MNTLYDNAVYVDWKSESEDFLFALREKYSEEYAFLLEQNFDELTENYVTKEPEVFLDALGQELTCFGYYLYELESESDSYVLIMVLMEEEKELKAILKEKQCKGRRRKQAKQKIGEPAKRIKLGKRLPCKKMSLAQEYSISLVIDCWDGVLFLDNIRSTGRKERRFWHSVTLNINEWPPAQSPEIDFLVRCIAQNNNGLFAVMVRLKDENNQEDCADDYYKVLIGDDIAKIEEWQCVYEMQNYKWDAMTWFGDELFVADKNCVYRVRDVMNFAATYEKVLELKEGDIRWYPKFCTVGSQLLLYMHQDIYRWEKASGFKKIHKVDKFYISDFVAVGDNMVAFQERPEYIIRGETASELTVLDITTLEVVKYPCRYGYVCKWMENRICVFPLVQTGKVPIIECFDFKTNEKKCLMYGALGKDCVTDIYETDCGTILQATSKDIYMTKHLWEFMKTEEV